MASIQRVVFGVAATLLIASLCGLSSLAQPAGRFSITYYYPIGDQCLRNTTGNVEIERDGVCINNGGSSNSAYKTCNSTHVQKWLCPQLNCLGQCTLENTWISGACSPGEKHECLDFSSPGWLPNFVGALGASPTKWHFNIAFNDTASPPACDMDSNTFVYAYNSEGTSSCLFDDASSTYRITTCNVSGLFTLACDDAICTNCRVDTLFFPVPMYGVCPSTGSEILGQARCIQGTLVAPVAPPARSPVAAPKTTSPVSKTPTSDASKFTWTLSTALVALASLAISAL